MQQWQSLSTKKERCISGRRLEDNKAAVAAQAEVDGGSGSVGTNESLRNLQIENVIWICAVVVADVQLVSTPILAAISAISIQALLPESLVARYVWSSKCGVRHPNGLIELRCR
jgi:hypothetical protein